jgi:hypothetical protein
MKKDIFEASFEDFDAGTAHEIADNTIEGGRRTLYQLLSHLAEDAVHKNYQRVCVGLSSLEKDILKARGFKIDPIDGNASLIRW